MALRFAYGLNESSGTSFAEASGGQSGVVQTGGSFVAGKNGNGLLGNGTNSGGIVTFPTTVATSGWSGLTVSFWWKPSQTSNQFMVMGNGGGNLFGFQYDAGAFKPWLFTGGSLRQGSYTMSITAGTWYHVAITWSSSTSTVTYVVNGTAVATVTGATGALPDMPDLTVSGYPSYSTGVAGVIDDLRINDTALTAAELSTLSASGVSSGAAYSGTAALTGSGSLGVSGAPSVARTAALTGSGTLTTSGSIGGTIALTGSGSLGVSGSPRPTGTVTLGGSGTLSAAGVPAPAAAVPLFGSGTLTAAGKPSTAGAVALSGSGTLGVSGQVDRWTYAVSQRASRLATVLFVGDSLVEGQGATTKANRWMDLFLGKLRTRYTVAAGGPGAIPASYYTYGTSSSWASPATTTGTLGGGGGGKGVFLASGQYVQWSVTGDAVDVIYMRYASGGNLTVTVDGTATGQTITGGGADTAGNKARVTFGSSGSHTVRLTATGNGTTVEAVVPYNGDSSAGFSFYDNAHTSWESDRTASGTDSWNGWLNLAPDLVIDDQVGTNDYLHETATPATVTSRLTARLNRYAAMTNPPTVVVLIPMVPPQLASSSANSLGYTYAQYWDGCKTAAQSAGVKVLDLRTLHPSPSASWFDTDDLHSSNAGHQVYATDVDSFLATAESYSGTVPLTGLGTLTTAGKPSVGSTVPLTGLGTLTAAGQPSPQGAVALSGSGSLGASGTPSTTRTVALSGSGTLNASGTPTAPGTAALTGAGTLTAGGNPSSAGAVSLSGSGQLSTSGSGSQPGAAGMTGNGQLSLTGQPSAAGTVAFTGSGQLGPSGSPAFVGAAVLTGAGVLAVGGTPGWVSAVTLTGAGALSASGASGGAVGVTLTGSGLLSASGLAGGYGGTVILTGLGSLAAFGVPAVTRLVNLSGVGVLVVSTAGGSGQNITVTVAVRRRGRVVVAASRR